MSYYGTQPSSGQAKNLNFTLSIKIKESIRPILTLQNLKFPKNYLADSKSFLYSNLQMSPESTDRQTKSNKKRIDSFIAETDKGIADVDRHKKRAN